MGYSICYGWNRTHKRRTCDRCGACPRCQGFKAHRVNSAVAPYGFEDGRAGLVGYFCPSCTPAVTLALAGR